MKAIITDALHCCMSTIMDGCTKELLAWVLSESLEVDFVLETANQLIEKHKISLFKETLIHSDGSDEKCFMDIDTTANGINNFKHKHHPSGI